MGLRKEAPLAPLNNDDRRLMLKIIHDSKNLHGREFEKMVHLVTKIQEHIKREEAK